MFHTRHRRRTLSGLFTLIAGALSCGESTAPLSTADYVGQYELTAVDGHPIGWYHQLNGVNCRAAFTLGDLSISAEMRWRLDLEYDYRCLGAVSGDGEGRLITSGNVVRSTSELIILNGLGPHPASPEILINWSIELRPLDETVEVRFTGSVREFWADPVLTMTRAAVAEGFRPLVADR
jgi:hypothetical protein